MADEAAGKKQGGDDAARSRDNGTFARGFGQLATSGMAQQPAKAEAPPTFQPEPFWPKPLPGKLDSRSGGRNRDSPERQHLDSASPRRRWWTTRRERRRTRPRPNAARRHRPSWNSTSTEICCATGAAPGDGYKWVQNEHGLHIDKDGTVWVGGNNDGDQILHFTPDGKFINQIGKDDGTKGPRSGDTARLNRPAHMFTDDAANEIYVADGYGNRRVIVFDSRDRRLQAPLGRLRQCAERRQAAALLADRRRCRSSSPIRCIACAFRTTGSSTCATGRTTASRFSRRTASS
jgi:hypothetical protein